jgi:hypothetical protein
MLFMLWTLAGSGHQQAHGPAGAGPWLPSESGGHARVLKDRCFDNLLGRLSLPYDVLQAFGAFGRKVALARPQGHPCGQVPDPRCSQRCVPFHDVLAERHLHILRRPPILLASV